METIEELSTTAAEEIDSREAELVKLREALSDQNRWKKKLEVCDPPPLLPALCCDWSFLPPSVPLLSRVQELSRAYDALLRQHSEVVDERTDIPTSAFHEFR
jgi:hypothetical protein